MKAMFKHVLGLPLPENQPPVRAEQVPEEALQEPIEKSAKKPTQPSQEKPNGIRQ
jgi:hypothetical protein